MILLAVGDDFNWQNCMIFYRILRLTNNSTFNSTKWNWMCKRCVLILFNFQQNFSNCRWWNDCVLLGNKLHYSLGTHTFLVISLWVGETQRNSNFFWLVIPFEKHTRMMWVLMAAKLIWLQVSSRVFIPLFHRHTLTHTHTHTSNEWWLYWWTHHIEWTNQQSLGCRMHPHGHTNTQTQMSSGDCIGFIPKSVRTTMCSRVYETRQCVRWIGVKWGTGFVMWWNSNEYFEMSKRWQWLPPKKLMMIHRIMTIVAVQTEIIG